jgi:hypothetical protein
MDKFAFQDGTEFYDETTGKLLVSYSGVILMGSYATFLAQVARCLFKLEFPTYRFAGE